ncbi:hypothetical protein BCV69DRAFT_300046 [Microstroma glucosiphilum]|uniref:DUF952-domain-containing protein n=1 Tax=Pseudomicrostroma glucosiphilum TaxID=1684307 RepID=A0A316U4K6_9BASI|nr:hypothetical protein BCV69DRAFT_300046 [Pseudomicrostroma glucosiphilum]PWN19738.1 hypothetical protein BCV69DRAFT_300046 [Pseudomicrostroma glucosiphilum]
MSSSSSSGQVDPKSATMLYKILTPSDYQSLPEGEEEEWLGASIDLTDKFIHLSTSSQLPGTLQRFFSSASGVGDSLWLCGARRQQLEEDMQGKRKLQWDPAAGSVFAHVYGAIYPAKEFVFKEEIRRDASTGEFVLPELQS